MPAKKVTGPVSYRKRVNKKFKRRNYMTKPYSLGLAPRAAVNRHYIKRNTSTVNGIASITCPAIDSFGAFEFKLSDLPNYAELQALFDNYQIRCVVLKLTPVRLQQLDEIAAPPATYEVPRLFYCWDYDDSTSPSTITEIQQYATCKVVPFTQPVTIKVYPKLSMTAYNGLTSSYVRPTPQLQKMLLNDCAYPNTPHYGIKFGVSVGAAGSSGIYSYRVDATYYLKMFGLI